MPSHLWFTGQRRPSTAPDLGPMWLSRVLKTPPQLLAGFIVSRILFRKARIQLSARIRLTPRIKSGLAGRNEGPMFGSPSLATLLAALGVPEALLTATEKMGVRWVWGGLPWPPPSPRYGTPGAFALPLPLAATSSFSLSLSPPSNNGEPEENELLAPVPSSSSSFFLIVVSSFRNFLYSSRSVPFFYRNLVFITPRPRRLDGPLEGMPRRELEDDD